MDETTTATDETSENTSQVAQQPDSQAEKTQTVEDAVRASVNLGPAVATLAAEVESLKKQLAEILPIKNVKYPAALHTVHRFREAHPDSPVTVAPEIEDDLKTL